eukprot:8614355-Prorocentrum_lima.AAC.1
MTSSLVGSEMCIRDRVVEVEAVEVASYLLLLLLLFMLVWGGCEGSGGGAVSYTHLTLPTICSV